VAGTRSVARIREQEKGDASQLGSIFLICSAISFIFCRVSLKDAVMDPLGLTSFVQSINKAVCNPAATSRSRSHKKDTRKARKRGRRLRNGKRMQTWKRRAMLLLNSDMHALYHVHTATYGHLKGFLSSSSLCWLYEHKSS